MIDSISVVGLSVEDLLKIKTKLNDSCQEIPVGLPRGTSRIMNLDLKDLLSFLDRDKVQLFADMTSEIKILKDKLNNISKIAEH